MTKVQKAQLRQSELKTEIAAELDKEIEQREEGRLTREAQAVEVELRTALTIEAETTIPDRIDTPRAVSCASCVGAVSVNGKVSFLESLIVGQGREAGRKLQLLNGCAFHQKTRRRLPASKYRTLPCLSPMV